MKKSLKLIVVVLIALAPYYSKLNAQESLVTSGSDFVVNEGSVSFSIGQTFYLSTFGNTGTINQGIQQPYEIYTVSLKEETTLGIKLTIFPNPTDDKLVVNVDDLTNKSLFYHLLNLQGKIIESGYINGNQTEINLKNLVSAIYFLNITMGNKTIKSFKIIKN